MKDKKFKIGDRVKITKPDRETGSYSWDDTMDFMDGHTYTITSDYDKYFYVDE